MTMQFEWGADNKAESTEILGCRLELTCWACPEQYEVYLGSEHIGYLRLRHGGFTAEYPECGGELVYEAEPLGDGYFEERERHGFLVEAVTALLLKHHEAPHAPAQREVSEKEFFDAIGPMDVHPEISGGHPYTSIFRQRYDRTEVGRIESGDHTKPSRYFLTPKARDEQA